MQRIQGPTATPTNQFTEGSVTGGVPATVVTGDWLNNVQEEICAVIEDAGIVLDSGNQAQLLAAINAKIAAAIPSAPPDASTTEKGVIEIATDAEHITGASATLAATPAGIAAREAARRFTSGLQVITAGGSLTIPHGLGARPVHLSAELVCQVAEAGYGVGDPVPVSINQMSASASYGVSIVPDSTNLNLRYGSSGGAFVLINFGTGGLANITPANWRLRIVADL